MATTRPMNLPSERSPASTASTVIGPGLRVDGRITGEESLRVEGHVEGSIDLQEALYIASQGVVVAEIQARDIVVSGIAIGNLVAQDIVILEPGSKVVGDVQAPRVVIEDGAVFSGKVATTGEAPPRAVRRATTSRAPVRRAESGTLTTPTPPRATRRPKVSEDAPPPPPEAPASASASADATPPDERPKTTKASRTKKSTKKAPRARVPKPGKRKVTRRS